MTGPRLHCRSFTTNAVRRRRTQWSGAAALLLALVLTLTACGQGSSNSAQTSASGGAAAGAVDTASAQEEVARYSGKPTPFPVDQPLERSFAPDAKFVFLQCSSPICALLGDLLGGAATAMGVDYTVIKAGASVGEQQSAADSVVDLNPAGVLVAGIDPSAIGPQLKTLTGKGVAVTSMGLVDTSQYGVQTSLTGDAQAQLASVLAAWTVVKHGGNAQAVVYTIPELPFSKVVAEAYVARMQQLCPGCPVRTVNIPVAEIGTQAPSTVVSDLQSNPDTNVAMFTTMETAQGLPAAMKTAGLTVDAIGIAPTPGNLADLKAGGLAAAVGIDLPTMVWMGLDATARVASKQQPTAAEKAGLPPVQLLLPQDITFDPTNGWNAYPDFADRFKAIWNQ